MKRSTFLLILLIATSGFLWADVNENLLAAAKKGDVSAMSDAVANGASVNHKTVLHETPLMYAIDECRVDAARWLIEKGANIEVQTKLQQTPLIKAATEGCVEIVQLLLDSEALIDRSTSKNEYNALFKAAEHNRLPTTERLLDYGADINYRNIFGMTPLLIATQKGHYEMVELLLERGADIQATSIIGKTPLLLALEFQHPDIANLLLEAGTDVNQVDTYNHSPLTFAAIFGYSDLVSSLVEMGADLNLKTKDDKTAALLAQEKEHMEIVQFLLEHGADTTGIVLPDTSSGEFEQLVDTTAYDKPPEPIGGLQAIQKRLRIPKRARDEGLSGTVIINVMVDQNGRVRETEVMESFDDEDCNKAAERAIRNTRWRAAKVGRKTVEGWVTIPVEFNVEP